MASRRAAASVVADTLVLAADGDLRAAIHTAWADSEAWWQLAVRAAGCEVTPDPGFRSLVRIVLQDRLEHPDPFDAFPRQP